MVMHRISDSLIRSPRLGGEQPWLVQRLGGLLIDRNFNLRRLLDRQVAWFRTLSTRNGSNSVAAFGAFAKEAFGRRDLAYAWKNLGEGVIQIVARARTSFSLSREIMTFGTDIKIEPVDPLVRPGFVGPSSALGALAELPGIWVGNGFNQIWRPFNSIPNSDRFLELNLTHAYCSSRNCFSPDFTRDGCYPLRIVAATT